MNCFEDELNNLINKNETWKNIEYRYISNTLLRTIKDPKNLEGSECSRCKEKLLLGLYYIDGNESNILFSNLDILCPKCRFTLNKFPLVKIRKKMTFASAHKLPNYDGKCKNWHGHEWVVELCIRKRIDEETLMVMDFKKLKEVMNEHIIEPLDHEIINKYIEIPTAENIIIWIWERLMYKGNLKGIHEINLWESADSYASIDVRDMLSAINLAGKI